MFLKELRKNRDIRNILAVLASAVVCAALLALYFLHYYGPSGRYLAGNTLLDPILMEKINFQDKHPKSGRNVSFIFDHIDFSYFDPQKGEKHQLISLDQYQKFYQMVRSERSLDEVSERIHDLFLQPKTALLTITMRTMEGSDVIATKIFQVVQFVSQDYFRVQLLERQEQQESGWAYFYQSGLYRDTMHLFTQSSEL